MKKSLGLSLMLKGTAVAVLLGLMGCADSLSTSKNLQDGFAVPADFIMIPKVNVPEMTDDQILNNKLAFALESQATTPKDKAECLYEMGVINDRMGLESTARSMFMASLTQNQQFAPAYNFIGVYLSQDGKYQDALDAFDAAIELNAKDPYPFFNRGLTLYYSGRIKSAIEDFSTYLEKGGEDPYGLLWLYQAHAELLGKSKAHALLAERYTKISQSQKDQQWGFNLVKLVLGTITYQQLFDGIRADINDPKNFSNNLCEAYFYAGKLAQLDGNDKLAYDYFQLCIATRRFGFLEYRYAMREMLRLEKKYGFIKSDVIE